MQIALLTGLRRGDILKLTWEQIDLKQRVIRMVLSKTRTPLVLPISNALADVLRGDPTVAAIRPACSRTGKVRSEPPGGCETIFEKRSERRDYRERECMICGTRRQRIFVVWGADLPVIQQLLGHRTIRTTLRYAHVHPTELRDAVNKLGGEDHHADAPSLHNYFTIGLSTSPCVGGRRSK